MVLLAKEDGNKVREKHREHAQRGAYGSVHDEELVQARLGCIAGFLKNNSTCTVNDVHGAATNQPGARTPSSAQVSVADAQRHLTSGPPPSEVNT